MARATAVGAGRRRIIRRPRLTRLLDESKARIILLVAPAGYGKTTLAQEWLGQQGRRAAWYRGGPASADVAALAVGLAAATSEIVPGAGDRMRERLRATERPEDEAELLAEMLAEDLTGWPPDAWLAIDDYHFAMESAAADGFVEALAVTSPLQFLVTSRRRPRWASARRRVYGEVAEIDRTLLAMRNEEALTVLASRDEEASRLVAQAEGWPALIGLAALAGSLTTPEGDLPTTLYDFFAEELYQAAGHDVRRALCELAVIPSISSQLALSILGDETGEVVVERGLRSGVITEVAGAVEIHPLLRQFLERKLREYGDKDVQETVQRVGNKMVEAQYWDDVFSVARRFDSPKLLITLVEAALDDLLLHGRTATLTRWLDYAAESHVSSPILDLAEAEVSFRDGDHTKAEILALEAARRLGDDHQLTSRAYSLAGQSAYFASRSEDALKHHAKAGQVVKSRREARTALWGQFLASLELELDLNRAENALIELDQLGHESPEDALRLATGRFVVSLGQGKSALDDLLSVLPLLSRTRDPLVRSSFLNACVGMLVLAGRYEESIQLGEQQISEAERYRLVFALPHAHLRRTSGLLGLRDFGRAHESLDHAEALAPESSDQKLTVSLRATRALIYLASGNQEQAERVFDPASDPKLPNSSLAEILAAHSLVLASSGKIDDAHRAATKASASSWAIEPRLLSRFALVIIACERGAKSAGKDLEAAFHSAVTADGIDCFVASYRAYPRLLSLLPPNHVERLQTILARANDYSIAKHAGIKISKLAPAETKYGTLSKREAEVYELLCQGLTNKQIARALFLSEATVKVHIRHIFEKLGVRTRTEAASLKRTLMPLD